MKKYYKKIYNVNSTKKSNIKQVIKKRYNILTIIIITVFTILLSGLFNTQILKNTLYENKINILSKNIVYSTSTPRGRIYDRNGLVIVDNEATKVIYYKRQPGVTTEMEIEYAYKMALLIDLNYTSIDDEDLKQFWILQNEQEANNLITEEEYNQYEERKLTYDQLQQLKLDRVTQNHIEEYTNVDRLANYIYNLMNKGYSYDDKVIKKDNVTDEEYAKVAENLTSLKGFDVRLDWNRVYPYGDTFRTILGTVSTTETGIPYELKDYYLNLGYSLNDRVGTSYLEYQYESLLKGEKTAYELLYDGTKKIVDEGSRGNDIVLTIDIELQQAVEQILIEEMIEAKSDPNTKYYDTSFVMITDPNTGEVLAMAGKQIKEISENEYEIYDYSPGVINHSVTAGSVVKGASHIVGYNNGALNIGELRSDECIKIEATPIKCSWTILGVNDDISALKYSSNVYQYKTAINVGNGNYKYDESLTLDVEAFDKYREVFSQFGLGEYTGIDLPNESTGYKGNSTLPGHLLDFSIGQFDNYTTIQLNQYINAIANDGYRVEPYLLKAVYEPTKEPLTEIIYEQQTTILNKIETESIYLDRVQEGFRQVMIPGGTGYSYMPYNQNPAGKTGTSESFIDTDSDGNIDTATMSNAFIGYAPYDNPEVAFTVITPDIYYQESQNETRSRVNSEISYRISQKYFELYK